MDGKFTALFEEHEHKWFVDMVMSWSDFDLFIKSMCDQFRKQDKQEVIKSHK